MSSARWEHPKNILPGLNRLRRPRRPPAAARWATRTGCSGVARIGSSSEAEETVVALCERIRREQRADECLTLMMAVERGVEALAILGHR